MALEPSHMLPLSRREMLARCGTGIGTIALAGVLADAHGRPPVAHAPGTAIDPLAPKTPHFPAKAKHVVHLFMNGGPSQVDTFDPKPLLDKYHGKPLPTGNLRTERKTGAAMRSPYKFKKYGQSGIEVSEIFAKTAGAHRRHVRHPRDVRRRAEPRAVADADELRRRPAAAAEPRSWVTYGLGSENRNLPGFVVMCPGGYPIVTTQNWRSAFLPGVLSGHVHRQPAHGSRQAHRQHPQHRTVRRRGSASNSTSSRRSTTST